MFSGIQPTGSLHLGNLLGAVRNWVHEQDQADSFYCVVDLHALTVPAAPGAVGSQTLELATTLLACGLDPARCTLFVQSHVPQHTSLGWILQCTTGFGELRRMTQFKEKSLGQDSVSAGLFTYPALQAADILLYDTDSVPVGEDQRQHIELTRDVAERFNSRYGETFVIPQAAVPTAGARVMDLQEPDRKMSKSSSTDAGIVGLDDPPESVVKKFKRAVTDSLGEVRYDPDAQPGVSNLLSILGAATNRAPESVAAEYTMYGPLKSDAGEAVVELLRPIQSQLAEFRSDPAAVAVALRTGADKAESVAAEVLERAERHIGLLPRR
ncbi:MAG: tryptophan--tRNA ligase [Actinobacteria bacterium]|nr:tryptophan--tRNA ligase [Actinomycetota bacterium]